MASPSIRYRLQLTGLVQGVGFRPFVYRLAREWGLRGWVRNQGGTVLMEVQGQEVDLTRFEQALLCQAPAPARPTLAEKELVPLSTEHGFSILASECASTANSTLPLDSYLCPHCLDELFDPANRRHRYPFINCSQCGPRYTLLDRLPYDRVHTGMRDFVLCQSCADEYRSPQDRRFHAEPIACPECGPALYFEQGSTTIDAPHDAYQAALGLLQEGGILALKGVGAYQLLCDAQNPGAVARLRQRKRRPHKPLAVMFPEQGEDGLAALSPRFQLDDTQRELLRSPVRPIVLCQGDGVGLDGIAPELGEIGVMLPGSPLHSLLLHDFNGPLVATSANPSGEPVVYTEAEARTRLHHIADAFLHHNRPIQQRADDPVYRPILGRPRPLRLGRGNAPLELKLPHPLPRPSLALGGQMKNAVALAWGDRCVLSPHIGELDSPRALTEFRQAIDALQRLYGIQAEQLIIDAHPGYGYWPWAKQSGLPIQTVSHHHAHASALYGEHPQRDEEILVFTWDGSGLGPDHSLWGGEGLLGRPGQWRHFSRMRPFRLPGGDLAAREPWRCALSLCWESGLSAPQMDEQQALLHQAWLRGLNSPYTSSVGRLFDGVAALLGLCHHASYEGQAAMLLESHAENVSDNNWLELPLEQRDDGRWQWDWQPLLARLLQPGLAPAQAARLFHLTLAQVIVSQAREARQELGIGRIGLSGGVFQNRLLTETTCQLLRSQGFEPMLHQALPCNDGGLAWGQIIEACGVLPHKTMLT